MKKSRQTKNLESTSRIKGSKIKMSANYNEISIRYGDLSTQKAPWSTPNLTTLQPERLKKIIEVQNEDIFALKLQCFEAQIQINQKDSEIQRLKEVIKEKLIYKPNKSV